ncbi:MAG: O-antigen ligase family protein [Elusimicrobiota bacterium]
MGSGKISFNSIYYSFVFLFLSVFLIPFNILNIIVAGVPFHYVYIGGFSTLLVSVIYIQKPRLTVFNRWLIFVVFGFSLSLLTSVDRIDTVRILTGFITKGIFVAFISERILQNKTKTTVKILISCAVLIALLGIIEFFFGWNVYPKPVDYPSFVITSTVGNPLVLAAYLILFLPLSVWYWENKRNIITFLSFFVITVGSIISFSRSGWFALFFAGVVYCLKKNFLKIIIKNWVYLISFVVFLGLIFFLMPKDAKDFFNYKFNSKMFASKSFEHRLKSYITTKNILKDYPLFGVGFGNYPKVHEKYMVEGVHKETPTPDNIYLRFLCDNGIVGGSVFFVFIIFWLLKLWKKRDNQLVWAIFCGLVGFLINQFTADLFLWAAPQFAFWLLLGFAVGELKNGYSQSF